MRLPVLILCEIIATSALFVASFQSEHIWVAQIDAGEHAAKQVAKDHGLAYEGKVPYLKNKFAFRLQEKSPVGHRVSDKLRRRVQRSIPQLHHHHIVHRRLSRHPEISWVSYQTARQRTKRDLVGFDKIPDLPELPSDWLYSGQRIFHPGQFSPAAVAPEPGLTESASASFLDPFWPRQWYLHDTRSSQEQPRLDLGVLAVWRRNITGRGVVVAVVDDGLEADHPDLSVNFEPAVSYDYVRGVRDPKPVYYNYEKERENGRTGTWHGTRCSGVIAMQANNSFCGVGIAFNARIGGVKLLTELGATDLVEARALTHALDKVHVYSNSWGPNDDGATFEGPRYLTREALKAGVELGRGGRGAIYVWASGNGGAEGDDCNCDGYSASVFTLTVGSASQRLLTPWYSESCSAAFAVAFSSGSRGEQMMVTADLRRQCAVDFTGTSASAPIAAGIAALALEANPSLTWRDLQHAVMWTAQPEPLERRSLGVGWRENSAGHRYHQKLGFGLFNVEALVELVWPDKWKTMPEKMESEMDNWECENGWTLSASHSVKCQLEVSSSGSSRRINYLEHVQLRVSMSYTERGALAIYLVSGAGSQSQLLSRRRWDASAEGLRDWEFLTVHFWGENPMGKWRLDIQDQSDSRRNRGRVEKLQLILHGTQDMPHHRARAGGRRSYENGDWTTESLP